MFRESLIRLTFLLSGRSHAEITEELQLHLEQQTERNLEAGMSPQEARRQAGVSFGGLARAQEQAREQHPRFWLETLMQDARYAVRGLRRKPTFTVTAVVTLMLGIGATTAVFSVVDRVLFRSLPYGQADRLVSVGLVAPIEPQEFMLGGSYYEWQDNQKPFTAMTSETGVDPCDLTEQKPARFTCAHVESNFLPTLEVGPVIGRNFTLDEDTLNGPKAAMISYGVWRRRFNLDPSVVGRSIHLDGHSFQIVGVLPKDFEMPRLQPVDILLPEALDVAAQRRANPGRPMWAFARLKPGVGIEQAKAELGPLFSYSLREAPPQFRKEVHLEVRSLRDRQMHDVRLAAWVLLALVLTVLLIACVNVTSLLLARGASREKELAMRAALGASRSRLTRQALTESLVLSVMGAAAGCVLAEALLHLFTTLSPEGLPFLTKAVIDGRILLFVLLTSFGCTLLFGLAPALHKPRSEALAGRTFMTMRQAVLRQWLVIVQVALCAVLLVGGALLTHSFWKLQNQPLGFKSDSVITADLSLGQNSYPTAQSQMAFFERLEQSLRYGPGVIELAMSDSVPPGGSHHDQIYASLDADGQSGAAPGTGGTVAWRWVTPDYFRALNIPILRGTGFTEAERGSKEHFVVLSKALANRLFPGKDPAGRRVRLAVGAPEAENPWYTVMGVAADVKNGGLAGGDEPEYYRLRRNTPEDWDRAAVVIVKTNLPASSIEPWMRSRVAALDPTIPFDVRTMSESLGTLADQPRFETLLVSLFACMGLVLAMVGLYGVISFLVAQRTQEIGLRMALGATRTDVLQLVLLNGLRLILPGVVMGLLLSLAASRLLAGILFQTGPQDPKVVSSVMLLLTLAALCATLAPAAAAMKVSPSVALRSE